MVILCLTGFASQNPYTIGVFTLLTVILNFLFKPTKSKISICLILLIFLFDSILRKSTSFPNYIILFTYILSFGSNFKVDRILIDKAIIAILIVNVIILFLFPGATQYLNFENEFIYKGYPRWIQLFLSNTISSFIFAIYAIKRESRTLILLVFLFLILAAKTTSLVLFTFFLLFKRVSLIKIIKLLSYGVLFIFILLEYNLIPEYLIRRINVLMLADFDSEYFIRLKLMNNSWQTFLENPFLGIGYFRVSFNDVQELLELPIGHHGHVIDTLARFGILGLVLFFYELKRWKSIGLMFPVMIWMFLNNIVSFEWLIVPILFSYEKNHAPSPWIKRRRNRKIFI